MSRVLRSLCALVMTVAVCLVLPGAAFAHSELVDSNPGEDQTVDRAVTSLRLTFEEAIDPELAHVVVAGGDGNRSTGQVEVDGAVVIVPVHPLDVAGRYEVSYRVVSADGHPVTDHFRFEVSAAGARAAQSLAAPDDAAAAGTDDPPTAESVPAADPLPAAAPATAGSSVEASTDWQSLAPQLGLAALVLAILGASLFRRTRLSRKARHV